MTKKATTLILKFTENLNTTLSIYKRKSLDLFTDEFTREEIDREYKKFLNTVSGMYYYDMLSEKDHENLYTMACDIYITACREYDKVRYNR